MVVLVSCEKKLSRDEAAKLIKSSTNLPQPVSKPLAKVYSIEAGHSPLTSNETAYLQLLSNLQSKSLITYNESFQQGMIFSFKQYNVQLTSEGQKYLINSDDKYYYLKVGDIDFGNITGMIEGNQPSKYVDVDYATVINNYTPFYDDLKDFGQQIDVGFKRIRIVKYDDGWRVQ